MDRRALLFADVVDSTALVQRLGDQAASALWAEHDRRARDLLTANAGQEIDRSDGFFLLFAHIAQAAAYARAYHDAVHELGLAVRVGLHVGTLILRHNPASDVAHGAKPIEAEGLAKPLAARIMALARGGQTLMSQAARDAFVALPEGSLIVDHGHYRLKGIDEPIPIFELGRHGDAFTPPVDSDKAYRVVLSQDLWLPVREVRHNLAPERDAFVGRSSELRELAQRLSGGCRLLTLVGAGGIGKTRTVRRYARAWLGDWPGGVYFCDLSEVRSLEGIHFAVALALSVPLGKDDPTVQLGNAIAGRARCLVILDNFEQVVEHAQATLGSWIDRAGDAAFLVTSRERLHLAGETVLEIQPLPLSDIAIGLFEVRAQAQQANFVVDDNNRTAVANVVELLDGLPLAIELAAARIRILSPQQIVKRLRDRFKLLAGARGAAARQATLKAAIDWSWELLQPWEQAAMAQCSVFEGGFTLEAAEAVLELKIWPDAPPTMDVVQALVDKSLLRSWMPKGQARLDIEEPHFAMYLSIHEYAADKLEVSGGTVVAQRAHGVCFARLGSDEAIESLFLHGGIGRRHSLSLEIDNLVAACRRSIQHGDGTVAVPSFRAASQVFDLQGPLTAGLALGAQVIAMKELDEALCAATHATLGRLSLRAGMLQEAGASFGQVIGLARGVGDETRELSAMGQLAYVFLLQGRVDEARAQFDATLPRLRKLGNLRLLGSTLGNLAVLHFEQGRIGDSLSCYNEANELHRQVGNRQGEGIAIGDLAIVHMNQGQFEGAAEGFAQAAAIHRDIGDCIGVGNNMHNLGLVRERQGHYTEAQQQIESALASYREVGARHFEGTALGNLGMVCHRQHDWVRARAHLMAALKIHRKTGDPRSEGIGLALLGSLDHDEGRLEAAEQCFEQSIAIFRRIGERRFMALANRALATLMLESHRLEEASIHLDEAEVVLNEVGDLFELAIAQCTRGRLLIRQGDPDRAGASLVAAQAAARTRSATPESELGRAIAELRDLLS